MSSCDATRGAGQARVVFDMAFHDYRVESTEKHIVATGAAQRLGRHLAADAGTKNYYLRKPLTEVIHSGSDTLPEEVSRALREPIDFFLLSYLSNTEAALAEEISLIRRLYPSSRIIIGGKGVTGPVRGGATTIGDIATVFGVDGVVVGDGEKAAAGIVQALTGAQRGQELGPVRKELISQIRGLYFKDFPNGEFEHNDTRINNPDPETFNAYTFQDLETIDPSLLETISEDVARRGYLNIHTSEGCLGHCLFCGSGRGERPVAWSAEKLISELFFIRDLIQRGLLPKKAFSISAVEDDFFFDPERVIFLFSLLKGHPELDEFDFVVEARVDSFFATSLDGLEINQRLLSAIPHKRILIVFGVDGFSDLALEELGKGKARMREIAILQEALSIEKIPYKFLAIIFPINKLSDARQFGGLSLAENSEVLSGLEDCLSRPINLGAETIYPELLNFNLRLLAIPGTPLYRLVKKAFDCDEFMFLGNGKSIPVMFSVRSRDPVISRFTEKLEHFIADGPFLDVIRRDKTVWNRTRHIFAAVRGKRFHSFIVEFNVENMPFRAMCFRALRMLLHDKPACWDEFSSAFAMKLLFALRDYFDVEKSASCR